MARSSQARVALALITLLLLLTAAFRLHGIITTPPGMHNDVAQYIADGLRISRSWSFPLSLDSRPEPFWRYFLAFVLWFTGHIPFAEKFSGFMVGILTIAVAYRAFRDLLGLWSWTTPLTRLLGALIGAAALTANIALQFQNEQGYRSNLLPLAIAVMMLFVARAWRRRTIRSFVWAGIASGLPVHTYTAGILAPPIALGILVYLMILGKPRPNWKNAAALVVAMLITIAPQVYLTLIVPDLYGHVRQMQAYGATLDAPVAPLIPPLPDLLNKLNGSIRAYYATGYYALNLNTPDTPFLNPVLALLAAFGILVCVWKWRTLPAVLTGAMVVALTLPGALSGDPADPGRLDGTFTPLAALAAIGAAGLMWLILWLARRVSAQPRVIRPILATGALVCVIASPLLSWAQVDAFWKNPKFWDKPDYWLSFPHYFSINFTDLLTMIKHIDHPIYFPLPQVDSATGAWYLWNEAFPNVVSSSQYTGQPASELWYPYAAEFNVALPTPAEQFVELVPGPNGRDGTIVILPPLKEDTALDLQHRVEQLGTPIIDPTYGWRLGAWLNVHVNDVTAAPVQADWRPVGATFGGAMQLVGYEAPQLLTPGKQIRVTLIWKTVATMNFDAFSFVQFLNMDDRPFATSDEWLYHWIHPTVFWQPGDVYADVRTLDLPPDMDPGAYKIAVGVYTAPRDDRLPVTDSNGVTLPDNWLTLVNHKIPLPALTIPVNASTENATFGNMLALAGYTTDHPLTDAKPGDTIHLRTYWQATAPIDRAYTLFVHVTDPQGNIAAQQDQQPLDGRYPTNVWSVNEVEALDYTLTIPANAAPGPYAFRVGAYSFPTLERLPVMQDGQAPDDRRAVLR